MERITRWFVHNSVASNMVMIFIIIAGALTIPLIKMEVFPAIEVDIVNITVLYPGASPGDVEEAICIRIEERLQGLEGIKRISSSANENVGSVNVEILPDQDISDMLDKVKAQVDAIDTFPVDVEEPSIQQFIAVSEVITVAVDGDVNESILIDFTESIKDELDALPEVTYTTLVGKRPREIAIEVAEITLRKYNLTLDQISRAIQSWSVNMPGGTIENKDGEILIRAENQSHSAAEFAAIPVIIDSRGAVVRLGDVSSIKDGLRSIYCHMLTVFAF